MWFEKYKHPRKLDLVMLVFLHMICAVNILVHCSISDESVDTRFQGTYLAFTNKVSLVGLSFIFYSMLFF